MANGMDQATADACYWHMMQQDISDSSSCQENVEIVPPDHEIDWGQIEPEGKSYFHKNLGA